MCEHGDTVLIEVWVHETVSYSGRREFRARPIDRCIARLVETLDRGGIYMLGSCCGHGRDPGEILLADGRTLTITYRE
jgi:hypothetical protein